MKRFKLDEVMTVKEVCEEYDWKLDTLRRFMNRGAIGLIDGVDYKKSGGTWIITKAGINKYINVKKNRVIKNNGENPHNI